MSDQDKSPLESILFQLLEKASAKFSETDLPVSPETMATTVVDLVATPEFWASLWTTGTKKELTEAITPYVKAWYEGRLVRAKWPHISDGLFNSAAGGARVEERGDSLG